MADISISHESLGTFSRRTKDGRTLKYEMSILQQPQRARACGAGAKSSADRRPVDPPPVVELKVFEGEKDITFQHNASFFLYTTLESARQIATPKGATLPTQQPVLTGTPVAGMAYLDRPCHAGYFIFPDLSVRHEGKYRLSFNLFEESKVDADMDPDGDSPNKDHPSAKLLHRSPSNPYQTVSFRMEVKSDAFNVFSAKKFPGLTESTALSRVVAEQGCRVRIRRDVRIRVRKDNKPSNDDLNGDSSDRGDGYPTPVTDHKSLDRTRSSSNSSLNSSLQPYPTIEAKAVNHDQQYIRQGPYNQHTVIAPQPPTSVYPSHATFSNSAQQYQPPHPVPHSQNYAQHPYTQQNPHSRQSSASSSQEFHHHQQQYPTSYVPAPPSKRENVVVVDAKYASQPQSYHSTPATASSSSVLPPLANVQPLVASSPTSYEAPSFPSHTSTKSKRGYGSVFSGVSSTSAVQYGARPETAGEELPMVETEEHGIISEDQLSSMKDMLHYRRADGSRRVMRVPTGSF